MALDFGPPKVQAPIESGRTEIGVGKLETKIESGRTGTGVGKVAGTGKKPGKVAPTTSASKKLTLP